MGEKLDELKRSGVVSHIAVVPFKHVLETGLSLEELDRALINFVNSRGIEIGDIPPLTISLEHKPEFDRDLDYFRLIVSRDEARKLLEGVTKPYGKVVVIYKNDIWSRIRLACSISKVLAIHGLREYIVLTEKPIDNILIEFENAVLVLDKMIPVRQTKE